MTTGSKSWTEEKLNIAGTTLDLVKGGSGQPLLILHDEIGHPGWLSFQETLSQRNTLYVPHHPGFGTSERLDWIMNIRDMAAWYLRALDEMGLGAVPVVGFSLGGWIAAEMAVMCPHQFNKMVLVGPMGVRPATGEIMDMFLMVVKNFITAGFHQPGNTPEFQVICPDEPTPEQAETWEIARVQASTLGWRPYMHDMSLPHLLPRLQTLPTLVICGKEDAVVPVSASEAYRDAIPGSRLEVMEGCGHRPEVENPGEFVQLVQGFLSG